MKLIAGMDPGLITAVALMDVNSDFYKVYSKKDFSFSDVCDFLVKEGSPIVVCTDVKNPPSVVKKIASAFNARLITPKKNLSISEKKVLTEDKIYDNTHERDALAAALETKNSLSKLFEKICRTNPKTYSNR